jgi:hypothetical protein
LLGRWGAFYYGRNFFQAVVQELALIGVDLSVFGGLL